MWLSYAKFEISKNSLDQARNILQKAELFFKASQNKEDRALLLESWLEIERDLDDKELIEKIEKKLPKKVKKKRKLENINEDAGYEECLEYIFPDKETESRNLKILEMAHKWKQQQNNNN